MNSNVEIWIKALRSGKYSQGTGSLSRTVKQDGETETNFCCLGVACDLYDKFMMSEGQESSWLPNDIKEFTMDESYEVRVRHFRVEQRNERGEVETGWEDSHLPFEVQSWLGLTTNDGSFNVESKMDTNTLADLNDSDQLTFSEIADLIEEEPSGLFIVPKGSGQLV